MIVLYTKAYLRKDFFFKNLAEPQPIPYCAKHMVPTLNPKLKSKLRVNYIGTRAPLCFGCYFCWFCN